VVERLRRDTSWSQLDSTGDGFAPYVEYVAQNEPERQNGRHTLLFLAQEVFWQMVVVYAAPTEDASKRRSASMCPEENGSPITAYPENRSPLPSGMVN
jgi:hypothetical protein